MFATLAELIIFLAVVVGVYFTLRPLKRILERKLGKFLRDKFGRKSERPIIDIDPLSGGEQVSVALALRLGMAHLLGSSNLNFVILDEPTTHLDSERRRSLVRVLSQLSNISNGTTGPLQFIIITHDAEIFEDSSVEKIYRFESSEDGTRVIPL